MLVCGMGLRLCAIAFVLWDYAGAGCGIMRVCGMGLCLCGLWDYACVRLLVWGVGLRLCGAWDYACVGRGIMLVKIGPFHMHLWCDGQAV